MISVLPPWVRWMLTLYADCLKAKASPPKYTVPPCRAALENCPVSGLITVRVPELFADHAQAIVRDYDTAVFSSNLNDE